MKKALRRVIQELYFYKGDEKILGVHSKITGDISSGLRGDISGIRGDVTNIQGNVNLCEITEKERKKGININDLIG